MDRLHADAATAAHRNAENQFIGPLRTTRRTRPRAFSSGSADPALFGSLEWNRGRLRLRDAQLVDETHVRAEETREDPRAVERRRERERARRALAHDRVAELRAEPGVRERHHRAAEVRAVEQLERRLIEKEIRSAR